MFRFFIVDYDDDYGVSEEYELCICKGEEQSQRVAEYLHADQTIFAWRKEEFNV